MTEETYQDVVDQVKGEGGEKDDVKEVKEETEKCETTVEEENGTTDLELETKPVEKVAMTKNSQRVERN